MSGEVERMAHRLRGWRAFWRALLIQRRKKHGAGRPPFRRSWMMARCAAYVAGGQHVNPGLGPLKMDLRDE